MKKLILTLFIYIFVSLTSQVFGNNLLNQIGAINSLQNAMGTNGTQQATNDFGLESDINLEDEKDDKPLTKKERLDALSDIERSYYLLEMENSDDFSIIKEDSNQLYSEKGINGYTNHSTNSSDQMNSRNQVNNIDQNQLIQQTLMQNQINNESPSNLPNGIHPINNNNYYSKDNNNKLNNSDLKNFDKNNNAFYSQDQIEENAIDDSKFVYQYGYDFFKPKRRKGTNNLQSNFQSLVDIPVSQDYLLGPGDTIVVYIWGKIEQKLELTIDTNGKVFLPQIGNVYLSGVQFNRLPKLLKKEFEKK